MFFSYRNLKSIFGIPAVVFIANWLSVWTVDMYERYPWFDMPMHVLGGAVIAISANRFINLAKKHRLMGNVSHWVRFLCIVSLVALVAVLWEFWEYGMDYFFHLSNQPSLSDTMADLALGLLGGGVMGAWYGIGRK